MSRSRRGTVRQNERFGPHNPRRAESRDGVGVVPEFVKQSVSVLSAYWCRPIHGFASAHPRDGAVALVWAELGVHDG